jgi:2-(1,2-epoxy-1,2-dihydrophenyl)acetyl-CoA isomerase
MAYETITCSKANQVATIALNRPQAMNALDFKMGDELLDCLLNLGDDPEVRAVILTGSGRAFSAGGDVRLFQQSLDKAPHLLLKRLTVPLHALIAEIRHMNKPVIAAINGFASGAGFSLALACDLIVAAESARFNSAYINIGLTPDGALTCFLPRLIGLQRASYLIFSGELVDARAAYEMGFVNRVVKDDELMKAVNELAARLAAAPTLAIARSKQLINQSILGMLETQMEQERQTIASSALTGDFKEGVTAFFAKRKAEFKGR